MIPTDPTPIFGNWYAGWALDVHTVSSTPLPDGGWDTTRTRLGESLFLFKFRGDIRRLDELGETVAVFLRKRGGLPALAGIIPVPPAVTDRPYQPVLVLAERVAQLTGIRYWPAFIVKTRATAQVKNIDDPESRAEELRGVFEVPSAELEGRSVLLLDDIYMRGETLSAATEALYSQGKVGRVCVVTLTRTRTKR